jgi:hypothetical protein
MSSAPAIDCSDLVKTYEDGRIRALNGISLRVEPGEFVPHECFPLGGSAGEDLRAARRPRRRAFEPSRYWPRLRSTETSRSVKAIEARERTRSR